MLFPCLFSFKRAPRKSPGVLVGRRALLKNESVFSIENQKFEFLNVGGFFTYRRGGERQTRIRPRSDPDGQTQIPQTPKTLGNNEGSGKCFGRETRLRVLECAVAVREPFEKLKAFSQTGFRKFTEKLCKSLPGAEKVYENHWFAQWFADAKSSTDRFRIAYKTCRLSRVLKT